MATGTAVGPSSICWADEENGVLNETIPDRTDRCGPLGHQPAGMARARRQRLEMYAEELVAIADHAARGTTHPEAINRARLRIDYPEMGALEAPAEDLRQSSRADR